MPGMAMSRIKQLVWARQSEARNSSADEKVRAANPNSLSKSGSDSRTDSSSSTTDRSGRSLPPLALGSAITETMRHLMGAVHCTLVLLPRTRDYRAHSMRRPPIDQSDLQEFRRQPNPLVCR